MWKAALLTVLLGASTQAHADRIAEPADKNPASEALDRQAITAGMASIKAKITSCGSIPGASGTVKVRVVVGPDGRVTSAASDRPAGDKLGACVAAAVKSIQFAKTEKGGSFSYPLVFGAAKPPAPEGPLPDGREQTAAPPPADNFDRAAIAAAMKTARPRITNCGDAELANGMVKLDVVVAADGRVTSAKTDRPAGDPLGTCIVGVMTSITFGKTPKGGSFSYPLVFGYRAKPSEQPDPTAPADTFDRSVVQPGIALVKAKIAACGTKTKANGTVKMRVVVGADGKVTSAIAEASPDPKLGACVAAVMKTATFKKTPSGGSFLYPFVFGSPSAPPTTTGPMPPPEPSDPLAPSPPAESAGLDRSMITAGIAKVKAKISACGTANASAKGTVKIKVEVAPAGTVKAAAVTSAPTETLGACVAGVLKGATFAKTAQGGSFSYPFVF